MGRDKTRKRNGGITEWRNCGMAELRNGGLRVKGGNKGIKGEGMDKLRRKG